MDITQKLANFAVELKYDDIPIKVIDKAKFHLLDWIGVTIAGSREEFAQRLVSFIKDLGGKEESTIAGFRTKTSAPQAAFVNGTISHLLEFDDVHPSLGHPGVTIIPSVLAIAEIEKATGKELIEAIVLGWEITIRVADIVMPSHGEYWHPTSTCGNFGAAVAAGKLMDLSQIEMTYALGIAGTQASGLKEVWGTQSKPFHAGKSAFNGIFASMLAKRGVTSTTKILEGRKGFCWATSKKPKFENALLNLGKDFGILKSGIKIYACCGGSHHALDSVLAIINKEDIVPEDIESVEISTWDSELLHPPLFTYEPQNRAQGQFSFPFCIAAAIVDRQLGIDQFTLANLRDNKILELAKKVKVSTRPLAEGTKVTIHIFSGKEFMHKTMIRKGRYGNPLTKEEIEGKFKKLVEPIFNIRRSQNILREVEMLDSMFNVCTLTEKLRKE